MTTTDLLLKRLKDTHVKLLGDNLVGIYLHGSYVLGAYREGVSDLDYLIVVEQPLTATTKAALMTLTLEQLWPLAPQKGLEFHVLLRRDIATFHAPCPFDFHFSKYHYQHYLDDPVQYIKTMHGTDPDLAAHLMILEKYGQTVWGPTISKVFGAVSPTDYWHSIQFDVANAQTQIMVTPTYTSLNLCRVLAYRWDGVILSKPGGGRWGLANLDQRWHPLLQAAIGAYTQPTTLTEVPTSELTAFATWMLQRIQAPN